MPQYMFRMPNEASTDQMGLNPIKDLKKISKTHGMLQLTTFIEAYKTLSMTINTRGQRSHLGNETKTSVPALILIESSKMC